MTFGENLKALRGARALSQKDLAEKLGFSFQTVSKWERNESLPDIDTLIEIASFFGTTTDSLLGYAQMSRTSTLAIEQSKCKVHTAYPQKEHVIEKLVFAIDHEGKIAGIIFVPYWGKYQGGYVREQYELLDDNSTLLYENTYDYQNTRITEHKKVRIPENGFLISVSNQSYAAKQMMRFIVPEEYGAYLDADTHAEYFNVGKGHFLLTDIIKKNELDHITVELVNKEVIFKKPAETIDPMAVNIETLAKIVRRELQREHSAQIEELKKRLDDMDDYDSYNESSIADLEERIEDLEAELAEIREQTAKILKLN